jgi:hypothetical protein
VDEHREILMWNKRGNDMANSLPRVDAEPIVAVLNRTEAQLRREEEAARVQSELSEKRRQYYERKAAVSNLVRLVMDQYHILVVTDQISQTEDAIMAAVESIPDENGRVPQGCLPGAAKAAAFGLDGLQAWLDGQPGHKPPALSAALEPKDEQAGGQSAP